jgi:hypothetical protein
MPRSDTSLKTRRQAKEESNRQGGYLSINLSLTLASLPHPLSAQGNYFVASRISNFPTSTRLLPSNVQVTTTSAVSDSQSLTKNEAPHPKLPHLRDKNLQIEPIILPPPPPRRGARNRGNRRQPPVSEEYITKADVGGIEGVMC